MFRDLLSPPITLAGHNFPVVNERSVRASAGLMLLLGVFGWFELLYTGSQSTLRLFAIVFIFELAIRILLGVRWAPVLMIGAFLVRKQSAEWSELRPKETAWIIGMLYASVACFAVAWVPGLPSWAMLATCGVCLLLLFFESAIGFCLGCWLHTRFSKTPPQLCPSGACRVA